MLCEASILRSSGNQRLDSAALSGSLISHHPPLCLLLLRYIHPEGALLGWRQKTCSIFLLLYPFNLRNYDFLTCHMSIHRYFAVTPLHDHSASLLHPTICSQKVLSSMPTNTDDDHIILGLKFYTNFLQVLFQVAICILHIIILNAGDSNLIKPQQVSKMMYQLSSSRLSIMKPMNNSSLTKALFHLDISLQLASAYL